MKNVEGDYFIIISAFFVCVLRVVFTSAGVFMIHRRTSS